MRFVLCILMLAVTSMFGDMDDVAKAAEKFKKSDSNKNLSRLASKVKKLEDNDELKDAFVKMAIMHQLKNNSKKFKDFLEDLKEDFEDVEVPSSVCSDCKKCEGKGHLLLKCELCKGSGKCGNKQCRDGKVTYKGFNDEVKTKNCPQCRTTLKCMKCNAKGAKETSCRTCKSKGIIVSKSLDKKLKAEMKRFFSDVKEAHEEFEEKKAELAKLEAEKKKKEAEELAKKQELLKNVDYTDPNKTPESMKIVVKEFSEWLNRQKRSAGAALATKIWGQRVDGKPVLFVEATDTLVKLDEDTKKQVTDGMLRFWKLRCKNNSIGSSSKADVILMNKAGKVLK